MTQRKRVVHRDARTGRLITMKQAGATPGGTVRETVPAPGTLNVTRDDLAVLVRLAARATRVKCVAHLEECGGKYTALSTVRATGDPDPQAVINEWLEETK